MSAHRTSLSIHKPLYEAGLKAMTFRHCANYSEYVSVLIREDVERMEHRRAAAATSAVLAEDQADYGTSVKHYKKPAA